MRARIAGMLRRRGLTMRLSAAAKPRPARLELEARLAELTRRRENGGV